MTSHYGTRNVALIGIVGIAYVVVALAPQEAASQPVAEERGREYILTRLWDLLGSLQQARDDDAEGVVPIHPSITHPAMGRTLR